MRIKHGESATLVVCPRATAIAARPSGRHFTRLGERSRKRQTLPAPKSTKSATRSSVSRSAKTQCFPKQQAGGAVGGAGRTRRPSQLDSEEEGQANAFGLVGRAFAYPS